MKLVKANPDAIKYKSKNGRLPIHYATSSKNNNYIYLFKLLLNYYPSSISIQDQITGLYPSLLAASNVVGCNSSSAISSVYILLRKNPSVMCAGAF